MIVYKGTTRFFTMTKNGDKPLKVHHPPFSTLMQYIVTEITN
ncbi:hypothetical protein EDC44_12010 [Cricetibacter osteomyelitidis]|uniref:Uncharacterized protein n=1 Tax=Cricetibacter osteomyelitidis TaxID=1521931 RepID=A0A4V2T1E9_9PAST|nr:hypothetical protein EDC44_12010 [Cricetibacter osteomyelitidis]